MTNGKQVVVTSERRRRREQRAAANERARKKAAEAKAKGLCVACAKRPHIVGPRGGVGLCAECYQRKVTKPATRKAAESKHRREIAKAAGLCWQCAQHPATLGPRGGSGMCDECRARKKVAAAKWQEKRGGETERERSRLRWHKKKAKGLCGWCGERPPTIGPRGGRFLCDECRAEIRERRRGIWTGYWHRRRVLAMQAYGGRCQDCGTDDIRTLEFHHVNFDGAEQRGGRSNGDDQRRRMVKDIIKHGPLPDIALLCANCHRVRHWERSPHYARISHETTL